jgi:carbamate kinase
MAQTALIAVGGNSLIRASEPGGVTQMTEHLKRTAAAIVELLRDGLRPVITHGNGPQVGAALLRSETAADRAYPQTLDVCDACTQGEIGYEIEQAIENELERTGLTIPVVSIITQTLVRADDPAFRNPTKPIGMFYSLEEAQQRIATLHWKMVRDRNRGYRRVVASPDPVEIVEIETLRRLLAAGTLVIAAGGGGIPVVRTGEGLQGVEAVIDKDLASSLLATELGLQVLFITTDVEFAYADYGTLMQRPIHCATVEDLEELREQGHFPAGNMGPKIEAIIRFLRAGGERGVITDYRHLHDAMLGMAGTQIISGRRGNGLVREREGTPAATG